MNEPIVLVCAGTGIAPFRAFFQLIEKVQKSHPGSFPDVSDLFLDLKLFLIIFGKGSIVFWMPKSKSRFSIWRRA